MGAQTQKGAALQAQLGAQPDGQPLFQLPPGYQAGNKPVLHLGGDNMVMRSHAANNWALGESPLLGQSPFFKSSGDKAVAVGVDNSFFGGNSLNWLERLEMIGTQNNAPEGNGMLLGGALRRGGMDMATKRNVDRARARSAEHVQYVACGTVDPPVRATRAIRGS